MYNVRYVNADSIRKDLASIPEKIRNQILKAAESLKDYGPFMRGIVSMKGFKKRKRKKVGNYRIVFEIEGTTLWITNIDNRKDVYR